MAESFHLPTTYNRSSLRAFSAFACRVFATLLIFLVWTPANPSGSVLADDVATPLQIEFFEKEVRPLLFARCCECHSIKDVNGGLRLDTREGVRAGGDSGAAIMPGEPDRSLLIEAVRYKNRDLQMPPKNALSPDEVRVLEKWVEMGAPDPRAEVTSTAVAPTGMSIEDGRQFWSLLPVSNPAIPEVENTEWIQSPVDAFVLSRLENSDLSPADKADRRTLIRRLTFNLTGLPPTPAEVDAFVNDESDDAWLKLVERLLASPQYGVRWGRHWLDVARYADSNGLDENLAYGNAWRYRDYVIESFNNNKPFNQFLIEQLAGDLLPHADQDTRTATGFLMLGAKVLAEPDMEKLVMDTIDEQLDSTGKAFMGMTLGCARCHDHKFDPIKQTDYYALGAIFKSTRTFAETRAGAIKHWHEFSVATEEELAALKEVDGKIAKLKSAASSFKNKAMAAIRDKAREKATEYLMAATKFEPSAPLAQVSEIAAEFDLHPRILHHCRLHLAYNQDTPFFAQWTLLNKAGGADAVEHHYRPLFAEAAQALAAAKKKDPKAARLISPRLEEARAAVHDLSGFLAVPPKVDFAFDEKTLKEYFRLEEVARRFESSAADEPSVMSVSEEKTQPSLPIHIRGSHLNLGQAVDREFPEVMRTSAVRPVLPDNQSGRLQLAQWLASTKHPLTARVFVNRVWGWHFGRGIVGSTENFGKLGDRPTHPELLDWLAHRFMQSGWNVKELHRLILLSNSYQMSSQHSNPKRSKDVDPENHLLWKFRLQRLEAEPIRDAILATSNRLDLTVGGKTVPLRNRQFVFNHTSVDHTKYDSVRRSVYLPIIRNNLYSMFEQFDFPDPTMPTGRRNATVVAPQALLMMNSDLVMKSADALAKIALESQGEDVERVRVAYTRTLGRPPTDEEVKRAINFVGELTSGSVTATGVTRDAQLNAWSVFCQSLYASNEFIYVR